MSAMSILINNIHECHVNPYKQYIIVYKDGIFMSAMSILINNIHE